MKSALGIAQGTASPEDNLIETQPFLPGLSISSKVKMLTGIAALIGLLAIVALLSWMHRKVQNDERILAARIRQLEQVHLAQLEF